MKQVSLLSISAPYVWFRRRDGPFVEERADRRKTGLTAPPDAAILRKITDWPCAPRACVAEEAS